jgi:hypothetical protein
MKQSFQTYTPLERILPATGNAPSLLFGSQVSPPIKRQHLESQPLNLSRRLIFSGAEGEISDPPSTGTTGATGTTSRNAASIVTGTAHLFKFNDNNHITSKNPDRVVVALRKLPVPVYQAKRSIPNPLICVQSSSLPLKQDLTEQSRANLVKPCHPSGSSMDTPFPQHGESARQKERHPFACGVHGWGLERRC